MAVTKHRVAGSSAYVYAECQLYPSVIILSQCRPPCRRRAFAGCISILTQRATIARRRHALLFAQPEFEYYIVYIPLVLTRTICIRVQNPHSHTRTHARRRRRRFGVANGRGRDGSGGEETPNMSMSFLCNSIPHLITFCPQGQQKPLPPLSPPPPVRTRARHNNTAHTKTETDACPGSAAPYRPNRLPHSAAHQVVDDDDDNGPNPARSVSKYTRPFLVAHFGQTLWLPMARRNKQKNHSASVHK